MTSAHLFSIREKRFLGSLVSHSWGKILAPRHELETDENSSLLQT